VSGLIDQRRADRCGALNRLVASEWQSIERVCRGFTGTVNPAIVSTTRIAASLTEGSPPMTTIRQLLSKKGDNVFSVHPTDLLDAAIRKMAAKDIGSLVVMDGKILKGIVTERQYARHIALKGPVSSATSVLDIMETTILYVRPEQSVTECMAVMTNKRVRHLPVVDDGELVGIISIGDLVKSIIGDQKFTIDQLRHFLHGRH
jgi:CBS domain-containing protein